MSIMITRPGAALAAAAAIFVVNSVAVVSTAQAAGEVKCYGVNACKGHGFELTSKADCKAKGGKLKA